MGHLSEAAARITFPAARRPQEAVEEGTALLSYRCWRPTRESSLMRHETNTLVGRGGGGDNHAL